MIWFVLQKCVIVAQDKRCEKIVGNKCFAWMTSYKGSALLLVVTRAQWQHGKSVTAATNVFCRPLLFLTILFLFPSPCHQLLNIIYEVCDKSSQQIWLGVPWQIVQLSCNIWYWYCMVLRGRPSPSEKANKTSETLNLEDIKISKVRPGNYILTVSSKVVRERSK